MFFVRFYIAVCQLRSQIFKYSSSSSLSLSFLSFSLSLFVLHFSNLSLLHPWIITHNYHPWTLCTRTSSHTNTTVTVHTPIIRLIIVLSVHALSFRGTFYPLIILLICFWYTLIGSLESPPALFFQSWFLIFSRRKNVFNLCVNFRMMSMVDGAWYWIYCESRRWIWKERMFREIFVENSFCCENVKNILLTTRQILWISKRNEISYPSSFFSINLHYNLNIQPLCNYNEDLKKLLNFRSSNLYKQSKKKNLINQKKFLEDNSSR